ncbi:MAG: hypothetical protein IPM93_21655 [Candidatus Obscuribacter sp.]|nr:hypothetical protein [Candidatus Obscuribacter sp.]
MQNTQYHELSKEFLVTLDQEALINLVIQLDFKYQQLAENARIALADKYGRKTEHFISTGQLLLFSLSVNKLRILGFARLGPETRRKD